MPKNTKNQTQFDADPNGLKDAKVFMEGEGYRVTKVIRSQCRHHVLRVIDSEDVSWIVKVTREADDARCLKNEVRAHAFVQRVFQKANVFLFVPSGTFFHKGSWSFALFEEVKGAKQIVHSNLEDGFVQTLSGQDLENIFQAMFALHRLRRFDVPAFFLKRARAEYTNAKMSKKLWNQYLSPSVEAGIVSEVDAKALLEMHRKTAGSSRFVFHDFVPWNLLRRTDGGLSLVDGEYARWEMKWFDVAYFVLQSRVLMGEAAFSKKAFVFFIRRFQEVLPCERIEKEIWHPMVYWTGACLFMSIANPKLRRAARSLVKPVLDRDVDFFR